MSYAGYAADTNYALVSSPQGELRYFYVRPYNADSGGWGAFSSAGVLGFSSNITLIYDDDDINDVNRATAVKTILTDTSITNLSYISGTMPVWTVTLLPEDLVSSVYSAANYIYGDPVVISHGTSLSAEQLRNVAATGRGVVAMGQGGYLALSRINSNWSSWGFSGDPPSLTGTKTYGLGTSTLTKTRSAISSESIWFSPLYYNWLHTYYLKSSTTARLFVNDIYRMGTYISGGTPPPNAQIYADYVKYTYYYPVVREGRFLLYGFYEPPDYSYLHYGYPFLINLIARMDDF